MAFGRITKTYADYSGGNNPSPGNYLLQENQCRRSRNVRTTPTGSFRKRTGFTKLITNTDLTSRFDSLHSLFAVNLSTNSLLVSGKQVSATNDRIAKIVGTTVTTLKSSLTQGKRWEWVQAPGGAQGPVYGVNGTDTPQQWDGSASTTSDWTATTGTVPSSAKYLLFHTDRIWATGTTNVGRVQYSGLSTATVPGPDPRNWDSDNYVDLEPDDGQGMTGIGPVGPYVLVTKARKTYVITDPVSAANRKLSDEIGCVAHRSIVETPRGTFFLSGDVGVCVTNGSNVDADIGKEIQPLIDTAKALNPSLLPFCAGAYFDHSYWLSIPYGQVYNDLLLEYDLNTKSWWLHDGPVAQFALSDPSSSPKLYVAAQDAVTVDRAFTPSIWQDRDADYASKTFLESAYYALGAIHTNKHVNQIRVDARGSLTLKGASGFTDDYAAIEGQAYETTDEGGTFTQNDQGANFTLDGTSLFAPVVGTVEYRFPTPLNGFVRVLSLRYENDDSGDFEVDSTSIFATPRND